MIWSGVVQEHQFLMYGIRDDLDLSFWRLESQKPRKFLVDYYYCIIYQLWDHYKSSKTSCIRLPLKIKCLIFHDYNSERHSALFSSPMLLRHHKTTWQCHVGSVMFSGTLSSNHRGKLGIFMMICPSVFLLWDLILKFSISCLAWPC